MPFRVLFVCLGNICRSPTAEGVVAHLAKARGLADRLEVDSAGTIGFHTGRPPDMRTQRAAARRGYDLSALRARRLQEDDFERYDLLLAMDRMNWQDMVRLAPPQHRHKVRMFLEFAPGGEGSDVPDPYEEDGGAFDHVLDLVEGAAAGLLDHVERELRERGG